MSKINLDRLFHHILKPALGCTEPVAVALASAAATQAAYGWTGVDRTPPDHSIAATSIRLIRVEVSKSIFKNSFAIAIPNAEGHKGLVMSAALGVFCDPGKALRVFEDLHPVHVEAAQQLVSENRIRVEVNERASEVYIKTDVETDVESGGCLIFGEHSSVACLWRNGTVVHGSPNCERAGETQEVDLQQLRAMSFRDVIGLLDRVPSSVIALLRETVSRNMNACRAGIARPMGIGAGYFSNGNGVPTDYSQYLSRLTAAGSDARMSGHPVEIMTSAGSGNQGITATIPIVVYASANFIGEDRMLRALALSHLVTMYLTMHLGYLSAFCGVAIKAGIGAACGLTCLMGGTADDIERTVKIMAATLTGMICDGAKAGCALKVSAAAEMATRAAELSMKKAELPDDNGIIGATADETIANLATLNRSMAPVDQDIIQIMLAKVPR